MPSASTSWPSFTANASKSGSIETLGAAGLSEDFAVGVTSGEHPLVEPMPGVAERGFEGLTRGGGDVCRLRRLRSGIERVRRFRP